MSHPEPGCWGTAAGGRLIRPLLPLLQELRLRQDPSSQSAQYLAPPRDRLRPASPRCHYRACPKTTAPSFPCGTTTASWAERCSPRFLIGGCGDGWDNGPIAAEFLWASLRRLPNEGWRGAGRRGGGGSSGRPVGSCTLHGGRCL